MKKHLFKLSIITLLAFSKINAQKETIQWSVLGSGSSFSFVQNDVIESISGQVIVDKISDGNNNILSGFFSNPDAQSTNVTSADETNPIVIKNYTLFQNYPNPFNPSTKISYALPQNSFVELKVFNLLGQEIATLVNEQKPVGNYEVNFDASNLPSGVYIYKMKAGEYVQTKKMVLLK